MLQFCQLNFFCCNNFEMSSNNKTQVFYNTTTSSQPDALATNSINFLPGTVVRVLLCCITMLTIGHIAAFIEDYVRDVHTGVSKHIIRLFDFNLESNIPTLFSSLILFLSAFLLMIIWIYKKDNKIAGAHYWLTLCLIFIFLAIDETVQIHEQIAGMLRPSITNDLSGLLYWAWVIPYGLFAIFAALYFMKFVLALPPPTRKLFFEAGALYLFGALFLELAEGYFFKLYGLNHIYNRMLYFVEELCEMCGITIFIYALLNYMAAHHIWFTLKKK
jgi:hypothetical protein